MLLYKNLIRVFIALYGDFAFYIILPYQFKLQSVNNHRISNTLQKQ